ncbi:MAG: bifunctional phosphoserine phosphatase/homoserine phosphotransferase ThrH [Clostridia bacterium]|nr:bifunctional phosphoserine phosphatase/homoserine phosphotransferase ThrH [Clostridia bacterium]
MDLVCLDMEGVLTPEIWIEFARVSGIPALCRTTRDEPDYDKLMAWRMGILREHGLGLQDIQAVIAQIDPLPGAKAFLDALRDRAQVVIVSDTFEEFAKPLLEKLGRPTIFCNSLVVDADGFLTGIRMRVKDSKLATVRALQSVGFTTIAVGDSYNDLAMILHSKAGFLFRTTVKIKADYPQLSAFTEYSELLDAITASLG